MFVSRPYDRHMTVWILRWVPESQVHVQFVIVLCFAIGIRVIKDSIVRLQQESWGNEMPAATLSFTSILSYRTKGVVGHRKPPHR